MSLPWRVLALLTFARFTMGLQFQSLAAAGPMLTAEGMSHGTLGTLIGLYLLPGIALALPGGWLGQRHGEKRVLMAGLALMATGGLAQAMTGDPALMAAGRLAGGTGAVLLNVMSTRMTADWFDGRATVTAMGVLICSWPAGIALALVVLSPVAALSVSLALLLPSAVAGLALLLIAPIPARLSGPDAAPAQAPARLPARAWGMAGLAGAVWGLYNAGFILCLAFGADLLIAQGLPATRAALAVSLVGWLIIPGLALGGRIAARLRRPDLSLLVIMAVCALGLALLPVLPPSALLYAALGLAFAPPGALIMALPVRALAPAHRTLGFGMYFTVYYAAMALMPSLAGALRDATGSAAAPLWLGAASVAAAVLAAGLFFALLPRAPSATPGPGQR
jgi:predicted MFS family arabinose efflux permease